MGIIRAGFTGAFVGIIISIAALFVSYEWLKTLSGVGFLLAHAFGKVCIDTATDVCSLGDKFFSFIYTILGNVVAYFILGVIISLLFSIIKMWIRPGQQAQAAQPAQEAAPVQQQTQQVQEQPKPAPQIIVVTQPSKPKAKKKKK